MDHGTVLGDANKKPVPKNSPVMHCQRRYYQASSANCRERYIPVQYVGTYGVVCGSWGTHRMMLSLECVLLHVVQSIITVHRGHSMDTCRGPSMDTHRRPVKFVVTLAAIAKTHLTRQRRMTMTWQMVVTILPGQTVLRKKLGLISVFQVTEGSRARPGASRAAMETRVTS